MRRRLRPTPAGVAYGWGSNTVGQLGNGSGGTNISDSTTPVPVSMPAGVRFTTISAGFGQVLALDTGGNTWAWGDNVLGELGNPALSARGGYLSLTPVPVSMPAGVTFTAISAGQYFSLALDTHGNGWAWGSNDFLSLGNGDWGFRGYTATPVPVSMPAGVTFTAIAAGGPCLALDTEGRAWA
jgi:alpha-tubulin suppressor-like RCC1 family protein